MIIFAKKSKNMRLQVIIFLLAMTPVLAIAQSNSLDKVFLLGTEEQAYEQYTGEYSQSLLEATSGDITRAFEGWLDMQQAIDAYSQSQSYNLNGVKVWLHVFWGADGSIDHMGFLLRPDSRFVDSNELKVLLAGFIENYRFPLRSNAKFSHYTGATFPTLSQRKSD